MFLNTDLAQTGEVYTEQIIIKLKFNYEYYVDIIPIMGSKRFNLSIYKIIKINGKIFNNQF